MNHPLFKKSGLISVVIILVATGVFVFLKFRNKPQEISQAPVLRAETKNGSLVMKSFQPGLPQNANPRNPSEDSDNKTNNRVPGKVQPSTLQTKKVDHDKEDAVQINGENLVWLKKAYAVKKNVNHKKNSDLAPGFELVETTEMQSEPGLINGSKYTVLTDPEGFQKFILTGSIAIESKTQKEESFFDELAKKYNLKISYLAPQINTAFLQADNGQNILQLQNKILKNEPDLKSVKLELLGRGVKPQ